MRRCLFLFALLMFPAILFCQAIYLPGNDDPVYVFLDELASLNVISLNSVIKPLSRKTIKEKLIEISIKRSLLNKRQKAELLFYLEDFNNDELVPSRLSDSLTGKKQLKDSEFGYNPFGYRLKFRSFALSIRPVLGMKYMINQNSAITDLQGGGDLFGSLGKHLGFSFRVGQSWESQLLVQPGYYVLDDGRNWVNAGKGSVNNTEWQGGISYCWKWGDFGIYKGRPEWGTNEHGSCILSGRAPSFPYIHLHLCPAKWIEFHYIHGWLKSNIIDSLNSSGDGDNFKAVYLDKFIAANFVTIIPWTGINFSFGNSVIYSDDHLHPEFLIPILFYNPADANYSTASNHLGQNHQLFFDLNVQKIKHLKLYSELFIDEISISHMFSKSRQTNLISFKGGAKIDDLLIRNISLTIEYTRTNPLVYQHFIGAISFYSDDYCLGNYLKDNSGELYLALASKPFRGFVIIVSWTSAKHGNDYIYLEEQHYGIPYLQTITWKMQTTCIEVNWELVRNLVANLSYQYRVHTGNVDYTPKFFLGTTNTLQIGIKLGL